MSLPFLSPNCSVVLKCMGFHWSPLPSCSQTSTTHAFNEGIHLLKEQSLHYKSFYNFTLLSFPKTKEVLVMIPPQSLLMVFHDPTPKPPLNTQEDNPLSFSNFLMITCSKGTCSLKYISNPTCQEALLRIERSLLWSSLFCFLLYAINHFTKSVFLFVFFSLKLSSPLKKSFEFSKSSLTFSWMTKRDVKWMGKLEMLGSSANGN